MPLQFNRDSLEEWRAHPLTQAYHRYLLHLRDRLKEQWASGEALDLRHQTKALLLQELASLSFEDYADAMGVPLDDSAPQ